MSDFIYKSPYSNPEPYIPSSLGEIYDQLGSIILKAPTFIDKTGYFPNHDINLRFYQLDTGLGRVKPKLGENNYTKAITFSARAKALFLEDPDMTNGKTKEGIWLLDEISQLITDARRRRVKAKLRDDEGEVTGD